MSRHNQLALAFTLTAAALLPVTANAETRVTYKSAKSTSSYYQMGVQLAEAVKKGSGGNIILTVEESQGIGAKRQGSRIADRQLRFHHTTCAGQAGDGRQEDV